MAIKSKSKAGNDSAVNGLFSAFPAAFMGNLPGGAPTNGYADMWQAYTACAEEMNKEFMSFVATRLQHDAELGQSLAQCSDWADAANVHGEWLRQMSEEYVAEAGKLMGIASSGAQKSWQHAADGSAATGAKDD